MSQNIIKEGVSTPLQMIIGVVSAALFASGVWFPVIKTTTGYAYSIVGIPAIVMYGVAITLLLVNVFHDKFTRSTATRMFWLSALSALMGCAYSSYIADAGTNWFYYQTVADMPSWNSVNPEAYWAFLADKGYEINTLFGNLRQLYANWGPNVTYNQQTIFFDVINGMALNDAKALTKVTGPGVTLIPFGLLMVFASLCIQIWLAISTGRKRTTSTAVSSFVSVDAAPSPVTVICSGDTMPEPISSSITYNSIPPKLMEDCPPGVKGWSWGGFLLNWIWAIGNRTWIGLLAIIPGVSIVMAIILGLKGREWAWRNKSWTSVEEFNRIQKKWSMWGFGVWIGGFVMAFVFSFGIAFMSTLEQHKPQEPELVQGPSSLVTTPVHLPSASIHPLPEQMASPSVSKVEMPPPVLGNDKKRDVDDVAEVPKKKLATSTEKDCAKRSSISDRLICSNPEIGSTDDKLNAIYSQALSRVKDKKALAKEQAIWRQKSLVPCQTASCLLQKYNERIAELAIKELY